MKNLSLNDKLQDAYITREVLLRRASAGVAATLDARIVELGHELAALARRIDPVGPSTEIEKMRRRKQLDSEGSALISKRMAEMRQELKDALLAVGVSEAAFARKLLEEAINGLL